jgi:hypothetical protein
MSRVGIGVRVALAAATAAALLLAGPAAASPTTGAAAHGPAVARRGLVTAVHTATRGGYHIGIAVYDRSTGQTFTAGAADDRFVSASVVKVLIAARLLATGRMHGAVAALAYRMITQSDNDAADRLYPLAGGATLVRWVKRRYHVWDLGVPTGHRGEWGLTRITARGLVHVYAALAADRRVGPWLLAAMHHAHRYSSAGEYQFWGLPSATRNPAVKQGWNLAAGHANVNTTGFVDHDRYAVVILTRGRPATYGHPIFSMITRVARLALPGGRFPDA